MLSPRTVGILVEKELADAWRNRWFLLFAAAFTVLSLTLSWLSMAGAAMGGLASLGRTAASLVNLTLLVVPAMGLILGAGAIAPERERGALLTLLVQPVDLLEVLLGKFLGLVLAVSVAVTLGFGTAGLLIARRTGGEGTGPYLLFLALALLLAMVSIGLGLLISAFARRGSAATGAAVLAWFCLVFLGDLGVMGTSLALHLSGGQLLAAALLNPLEIYKVAAMLVLHGGLESLGPAGLYATRAYGDALLPGLIALLAAWALLSLAATRWALGRQGGVP